MNKQCKFKVGKYNCGSYAFSLYKEKIDQGDYCDHHYWQDQAIKARADEREACAQVVNDDRGLSDDDAIRVCRTIRARGQA